MKRQGLNRYNAPEMLSALVKALEVAGLDDTVKELKRRGFFKIVNDAWASREKLASRVAARWARTQTVPMLEPAFWKLVDKIGWGTKTTDSTAIRRAIMGKYSPAEAEGIRDIYDSLRDKLYHRLEAWEMESGIDLPLSDDGMDYFTSHVVGSGKKVYYAVMQDPSLSTKMANDYKEGFSYALPTADSYGDLKIQTYVNRAKKLRADYYEALRNRDMRFLHHDIKQMIELLEPMARGDAHTFIMSDPIGKKVAETIENKFRKMAEKFGGNTWDATNVLSNKWGVWNLYSDVDDYLVGPMKIKLAARWEARR